MSLEFSRLFSSAALGLRASEIRELLKLLNRPQMISFAGGLPNPEAFPVAELRNVVTHVMSDHASDALQYCPTEGHFRLRDAIAQGMGTHYGARQSVESILITTGAQQALHLLSSVLLDPGDIVATASPTYLGALLTFKSCRARVEGITSDTEGMIPDALDERMQALASAGQRVKFLYVVPTFQNPTGQTMGAERRKRIYEVACRHNTLIVEDDPYGLLRYEGEPVAPIKSLDEEGRVAYLGSFSKILAPGFRIGWLAANEVLTRKAVLAKQAQDLCTNTFGQYCIYEAMRHDVLFKHIESIKALYQRKRDIMLDALGELFPEQVQYSRPEGGMFLWVELPPGIDSLQLLSKAIEHDVAYVTGKPFFPDGSGHNTLRLNFSYAGDDRIVEGVRRLASVLRKELAIQSTGESGDHVGIF